MSNEISTGAGRGGFCRYGDAVWIDEGHRELVIHLSKVSAVLFRLNDLSKNVEMRVWMDGMNDEFVLRERPEGEARKLMSILAGDDKS